MRRPIVTKRSTANANTEESIPPAMSQRNQHLTHAMLRKPATTTPKQFQTTWCFGKDWQHAGGARDLQLATVLPGILPFRYTCKSIAFCQSCAIFRKKVTAAIFGAINTLAFWTPRSGPPQWTHWTMYATVQLSWFCSSTCRQFHCSVFGMVLQRFALVVNVPVSNLN